MTAGRLGPSGGDEEISQRGDEIPKRYLLEHAISPAIEASPTLWEETLLIDFSKLFAESLSDSLAQKELAKLHFALKHWGCFQQVHNWRSSLLEELLDMTKQIFALPLDEKLKYAKSGQHHFGYGNNTKISGDKPVDWFDQLFLSVYLENGINLQLWPQNPQNFREILQEYGLKVRLVYKGILKAMARSLKLKEESFLIQNDDEGANVTARLSIYPRCSRSDRVLGARPHSDPSTITILLPDDKMPDGLQIQKDDQWLKVPVKPGALFVNLGDCGQVMSNGIFKSVVHRVVTNVKLDRFSVTTFFMPGSKSEIGPINELISPNEPHLYKKVDVQTYRKVIFETLTLDTRVLDQLKI